MNVPGKSLDVASYRSGPKVTKQKESEDISVNNVDDEPINTLFQDNQGLPDAHLLVLFQLAAV